MEKEETLSAAAELSKLQKIQGLEQHEVVALAAIGENIISITDAAAGHNIRQDMERSGFTALACTLGLKSLVTNGLIEQVTLSDEEGYQFPGYKLTESGWAWVLANKSEFILKKPQSKRPKNMDQEFLDDDIPF